MRHPFHVVLFSSLMAGCLGSYGGDTGGGGNNPPPPPPGGETAREMFERTVSQPSEQACGLCHQTNLSSVDPDYLGASTATYYDSIKAYTSPTACADGTACLITFSDSSILVTKGLHTGPAWTAPQLAAVQAWLDKEVEERGLAPPVDPCIEDPTLPECGGGNTSLRPSTVPEALERFAACMDYDLWLAGPGNDDAQDRYNLSVSWANTEDGLCNGCHAVTSMSGACVGGSCLFINSWDTFAAHRLSPSILKLILPVSGPDGVDLIEANRYIQKGYEGGGGNDHPSFELRASCSNALRGFVQATLDKYHDYGTPCTPALPPP